MASRKQRSQEGKQEQEEDRRKNMAGANTDIRKEPSPDGNMGRMAGRETVGQMEHLIILECLCLDYWSSFPTHPFSNVYSSTCTVHTEHFLVNAVFSLFVAGPLYRTVYSVHHHVTSITFYPT